MTSDIYCNEAVKSPVQLSTVAVLSSTELWDRPAAVLEVMEVLYCTRNRRICKYGSIKRLRKCGSIGRVWKYVYESIGRFE